MHIFVQFISIFTIFVSICYHVAEANTHSDQIFLMINEGRWHVLDNIGAVTCLITLLSYLSNIKNEKLKKYIEYFGFGLTLITQVASPWDFSLGGLPIFFSILCF